VTSLAVPLGGPERGPLVLRGLFTSWITLLVVLPLAAVAARSVQGGASAFLAAITAPDAVSALILTVGLSVGVAALDVVLGLAVAWALVRYAFRGRALLSALVDLPFAVPTLVAGVLLVALLGPQTAMGSALAAAGLDVVFAVPGMVLALCFVTLPFVVRAVEPVLEELDPSEEEAARIMGASTWQVFWRVLLPPLLPALATGAAQSFARAVGEFGAMAVISGNIPGQTLVTSVYVLGEVEAGQTADASAVSLLLLAVAVGVQQLGTATRRLAGGPQ
jgi:sulfate/thiosulfate transport system permease protein